MTITTNAKSTLTDTWETPLFPHSGSTTNSTAEWNRRKWDEMISFPLIEWGRNPDRFDDEMVAPSAAAIDIACQLAIKCRDSKVTPPTWVVPSGDGGIYFRWGTIGESLFTAKIMTDGKVTITLTQNCELSGEKRSDKNAPACMAETDQPSADAIVYRRIPAVTGWVRDGKVDPAAFLPNPGDKIGGVSLAVSASAMEAAATGRRGKKFFAVAIRVGDMRDKGLEIVKDSESHAYIKGWVYDKRDDLEELAEYLCTICGLAEGPFDGAYDPPNDLLPYQANIIP